MTARYDSRMVLSLPILEFLHFVKAVEDKDLDEFIYKQYVSLLPHMYMEHLKRMTFKEYKDEITGANIDKRPIEAIMRDLDKAFGEK